MATPPNDRQSYWPEPSDRLKIRCGCLPQSQREDPDGRQDVREPDDLFAPLPTGPETPEAEE